MKTLLNKLFTQDISDIIYNFIVQDYINYVLVGKLYHNSLLMEKHIRNYNASVLKKSLYNPACIEITNIRKFLNYIKINFIEKKHMTHDKYFTELIYNFENLCT